MKFTKMRLSPCESGPNLTPLVDVVMVVLVFMMLAGTFGAATRVVDGAMVARGSGKGQSQALSLDVRVGNDPTSGGFVVTAGDLHIVGNSDDLFRGLHAKHDAYVAAGINPFDVLVIVRPSGNVSYQHVLTAYESARRAGFARIAFASSP